MNYSMINKKLVRKNKMMKKAQKEAKKRFGHVKGIAPKAKINKVVSLMQEDALDFTNKDSLLESLPIQLSQNDLFVKLNEVKLTGLSGDGFNIADKLQAFAQADCLQKYLIVNAVECDPGLLHDEWICQNMMDKVQSGINVLNKCFDFAQAYFVAKIKPKGNVYGAECVLVPNRYPMGYENEIIKSVMNVQLSVNDLPTDKGILVLNVQTVMKIGEIICNGANANSRYITIANLNEGKACVANVNVGDSIKKTITRVFPQAEREQIYTGSGAFYVETAKDTDTISLKTNFIAIGKRPDYENFVKCKGCGACSSKCPAGVNVKGIVQGLEKGLMEGFEQYNPQACIGCSACTYVCHAGKNTQAAVASVKKGEN